MVTMDAFASAFGFDSKSDDVWTTLGKVTAVGSGTLSVLLGGSATPTECEAYCLASVGDIVFVAITKGRARAIACKGVDAATWRNALSLGSMATEDSSDYLPVSGGTLTGSLAVNTTSVTFSDPTVWTSALGVDSVLNISETRATGDFDNLTTTGIYYTQNGMSANKPTTDSLYAYILVLGYDNVVTQVVFNNTNAVYVRNRTGNPPTWKAWSQL